MRLTTRLMQLASWLLLQRAVNEGELSAENARLEKEKVKFSGTPAERGGPGYAELPDDVDPELPKLSKPFTLEQLAEAVRQAGKFDETLA